MSEFKGAIFLSFIFAAIILPAILMFGIDSLHQNAFTKTTKEFSELVQEEAGLTEHVKMVKEELEKGGKYSKYSIRLIDSNGNEVTGTVPYGETITVKYEYTFGTIVPLRLASPKGNDKSESPFLQRTLKSSNALLITKRDALTKVTNQEGGKGQNTVTKTLKIKTNESKNRNQTQTFNIPNLGRITGVSVNTGSARIQSVLGDQLIFTFSNGSPSRKVQTGGEYKAGASKFVTNQNKAEYKDDEGYEGTLSEYVHSGEIKLGDSKFVTNQPKAEYKDDAGYEGTLEKYLYSGAYIPKQTKNVEDYKDSDTENFPSQLSYNTGGFTGVLNKLGEPQKIISSGTPANSLNVERKYGVSVEGYKEYKGKLEPIWRGYSRVHNGEVYTGDLYLIPGTEDWETKVVDGKTLYRAVGYYSGTLKKSDTRKYKYRQYYSGVVTKSATDNRVYRYQGTVFKPIVDTRIYRYQGTVRKPAVDTRTYDNYYQYEVTITYEPQNKEG